MEDLKIYICTHTDFECPVKNSVYEIIDNRGLESYVCPPGIKASFYSELSHLRYIADQKELPKYVGTCHYRLYFDFMDDIPDTSIIDKYGCIVTKPFEFRCTVQQQYIRAHNSGDLATAILIIKRHFPELWTSMREMLKGNKMYGGNLFIMKRDDFREMMDVVWEILDRYLWLIGYDVERRILMNPKHYHLDKPGRYGTVAYQYRIGGYLAERIISAWIMQRFPNAYAYNMRLTSKPLK